MTIIWYWYKLTITLNLCALARLLFQYHSTCFHSGAYLITTANRMSCRSSNTATIIAVTRFCSYLPHDFGEC